MNQDSYRKLISGQTQGQAAQILRACLAVAAAVYAVIIRLRNFLYSKRRLKIHRVDVPVFSIGNITVGGTGKTPLVIWLYNELIQNSKFKIQTCTILTRGYKSIRNLKLKIQNYNDEPAILARSCPQAKVIVNPNRVEAAAKAIETFGAEVLIMDDGFQHRRLGRDVDIVTIDATEPFGFERVLPAGLLREPLTSVKRAGAVVITRSDQVSEEKLAGIEERLRSINEAMIIARSIHAPVCAKTIGNKETGLEQLRDKEIFAFCGIGNPDAFLNTIEALDVELVGSKIYNDHHHYTDNDVTDIYNQAAVLEADLILTTQKDWTKTALLAPSKQDLPLAYLAIELRFTAGADRLKQLIDDTLAGKIPPAKTGSQ